MDTSLLVALLENINVYVCEFLVNFIKKRIMENLDYKNIKTHL